jgi:hypothetical protein
MACRDGRVTSGFALRSDLCPDAYRRSRRPFRVRRGFFGLRAFPAGVRCLGRGLAFRPRGGGSALPSLYTLGRLAGRPWCPPSLLRQSSAFRIGRLLTQPVYLSGLRPLHLCGTRLEGGHQGLSRRYGQREGEQRGWAPKALSLTPPRNRVGTEGSAPHLICQGRYRGAACEVRCRILPSLRVHASSVASVRRVALPCSMHSVAFPSTRRGAGVSGTKAIPM